MSNYLYFDVEFVNAKNKSICQIGLLVEDSATHELVCPGQEIYVNPADEFDIHCVNVHHITYERVKNEKRFNEIWPSIENLFVNSIIVGHNVCGADLDALCKNLIRYNISIPEFYYIDTYQLAKTFMSSIDVQSFSLSSLCKYFGIDTGTEHNAFDDACSCAALLKTLVLQYNIDPKKYVCHYEFQRDYKFTPYLSQLSVIRDLSLFLGEIKGILVDPQITTGEYEYLQSWYDEHKLLKGDRYWKELLSVFEDVLEDNKITSDEAERIEQVLLSITQEFSSSIETKATQTLQGIIKGVKVDSVLSEAELYGLQEWLYQNDYLSGHYPYDSIKTEIDKVLEDGIITEDERTHLLNIFDELFNPVKKINATLVCFEGKEFCLSGDFAYGSKKDVEKYIEQLGGITGSSVRKKTDYLVVGGLGSAAYSNGTYGKKVEKALEIGVTVITEKQLFNEI